jgi:tetratricopeptide (TPR) repeat protein
VPLFSSSPVRRALTLSVASTVLLTGCWSGQTSSFFDHWAKFFAQFFPTDQKEQELRNLSDLLIETYPRETLSGSYLSSRFAQGQFDWQKANDELNEVLLNDPTNLDLRQRALILSMGAGKDEDAFALAKSILETEPDNPIALLLSQFPLIKDGKFNEAAEALKKLPSNGLNDVIAPLVRSWAIAGARASAAETGASSKTANYLAGLQQNPVHIVHAILIADFLNDREGLKKFPARILVQLGLSNETIQQIEAIFVKHDLKEEARILAAFLNSMDALQGLSEKEKTLKLQDNQITTAQQGLSQAMYDMASTMAFQAPDSAMLFAQLSLYLSPERIDTPILIAQMQGQSQRYQDAIATLTTQLSRISDGDLQIKIKRQIAEYLEEKGNFKQAIHVLRDIVETNKNLEAQIQIGDIYRRHDKFSEALQEYNRAYELINQDPGAQYWYLIYSRGIVHERLKQWDRAEKDLKQALKYQPTNPYILNYLAYSWADQNINLSQAVEMLEKAATLKPDDGAIIDSLGWVYFRKGEYAKAVEKLELAIELMPYDPVINDHLGDAYWKVGRKNEARFQWKRALSFAPEPDLQKIIEQKIDQGYFNPLETKPQTQNL